MLWSGTPMPNGFMWTGPIQKKTNELVRAISPRTLPDAQDPYVVSTNPRDQKAAGRGRNSLTWFKPSKRATEAK